MIISIRFSYLFLFLAILKIRFMKEKIIYVFMLLIVIVSCTEEESFDEYGVRILKRMESFLRWIRDCHSI